MASKPRRSTLLLTVLAIVVVLISAALWGLHHFSTSWRASTEEVTDPSRYRAILNDLGYPKPTKLDVPTLSHFPPDIPASATNVRFYYRPGGLQGGAQLQLRCNLPTADLDDLLGWFKPKAKNIQSGGEFEDAVNAHHGLPSASFRNATNTGFEKLPADFQVLVLDAKAAPGAEKTWTTFWSYGVAISKQRQEAVFWVEDGW